MRVVLFDLGDTLERRGKARAGAKALLTALESARDGEGAPPELALLSDFGLASSAAVATRLRNDYMDDLRRLGLAKYFTPASKRVTLSSDVGWIKPDARLFRAAINKLKKGLPYSRVAFVTENPDHVRAARDLGMLAVQVGVPGQAGGEVAGLPQLLPVLQRLLAQAPVAKRRSGASLGS